MSSETNFAPAEWTLLKELPFKVIFAAVVSDVSGRVGAASKEVALGAHELVKLATSEYTGNDLIMSVLSAVADDPATEEDISLRDEEACQAAIVEAIALSSQAVAILNDHSDADVAAQYVHWIFLAADAVIRATRSGGFLGMGTSEVSDAERHFLEQLRIALNIEPLESNDN
jgi:hypothetical protein